MNSILNKIPVTTHNSMAIPRLTGFVLMASLPLATTAMALPAEAAVDQADLPSCLQPHPLLASAQLPSSETRTVAQAAPSTYDPCTYSVPPPPEPPVRGLW
ncbi:MAG: hypothetical protein ACK41W_03350 [Cyanobacteriota bacterium]